MAFAMLALPSSSVAAPNTTFTAGPTSGSTVTTSDVSFSFAASESDATFECRLDSGAYSACASPKALTGLSNGSHVFYVRAKDTLGVADPTPASRQFTVASTTPPETAWVTTPSSPTNDSTPTFEFSASPSAGATFECAYGPNVSGVTWSSCSSPWTAPAQPAGIFVFQVRAKGPTGLVDASPVMRSLTFDYTAPDTSITSGPTGGSTITTNNPTFAFSSPEPGVTYECRFDDELAFSACPNPKTYSGLQNGSHQFKVRAIDGAGNSDGTPDARLFTVAQPEVLTATNPVAPAASEDLSNDPTLGHAVDWVHWYGPTATDLDRKAGTFLAPIWSWTKYGGGLGTPITLTGGPTFVWNNADGTASGTASNGVANGGGNGRGLTFYVQASSAQTRKLKLWLGVRGNATTAALRAQFVGSQALVTKSVTGNSNTTVLNRTVTIDLRPSMSTDTLEVSWYQGGTGGAPASQNQQAVLYAAALY